MATNLDPDQDVSVEQYGSGDDQIKRLAKLYVDYGYQIEMLIMKSGQNYIVEVMKELNELCVKLKDITKDYYFNRQKKNGTYIEYKYPKIGATKLYIQAVFDDPSKISSKPSICVIVNNKVKNHDNFLKALENKINRKNFIEYERRYWYLVCDIDCSRSTIRKLAETMFTDFKHVINSVNEVVKLLDE